MPKLAPNSFETKDLLFARREGRLVEFAYTLDTKKEPKVTRLGSGSECFVFEYTNDDTKVLAVNINELSAKKAKRKFYIQRILHTLFPHNFPRIYSSFGTHPDETIESIPLTIRERIYEHKETAPSDSLKKKSRRASILFMVECFMNGAKVGKDDSYTVRWPVTNAIIGAGEILGKNLFLDASNQNFMFGEDGGEYYVDTYYSFSNDTEPFCIKEILARMKERGYTPQQQRVVKNSLMRLKNLSV